METEVKSPSASNRAPGLCPECVGRNSNAGAQIMRGLTPTMAAPPILQPPSWLLLGLGLLGLVARRFFTFTRRRSGLIAKAVLVALIPTSALAVVIRSTPLPAVAGGNQWTFDYVVTHGFGDPVIAEFTIYFDRALYANLAVAASPPAWSSLVAQPDSAIPADGFFDSLVIGAGIDAGKSQSGFAVSFLFLGLGTPGNQRFEVIDPSTFEVLRSGSTVVSNIPEPGRYLLASVGMLLLLSRRKLRSRVFAAAQ